jgi:hypothetical protein
MEVGTVLGMHGFKTFRDAFNDWHPAMFCLGQAHPADVVALWAANQFIPLVRHGGHLLGQGSRPGPGNRSVQNCSLSNQATTTFKPGHQGIETGQYRPIRGKTGAGTSFAK